MLALRIAHEQRLSTDSEYLATCLPKTEAFLRSRQHLVRLLRARIGTEVYRSLLDAVLCCFLPDQLDACRAFYEGTGKPLMELVSAKTRRAIDAHLRNSLRVLSTIYCEIVRSELWAKGHGHDALALEQALHAVGWAALPPQRGM